MNRSDCPTLTDALAEVKDIAGKIKGLVPSAKFSTWDRVNFCVALAVALAGLAAAPFSAGLSLIATVIGIVWILIDMLEKIREKVKDKSIQEYAGELRERLLFLAWCIQPS